MSETSGTSEKKYEMSQTVNYILGKVTYLMHQDPKPSMLELTTNEGTLIYADVACHDSENTVALYLKGEYVANVRPDVVKSIEVFE